MRFIGLDIGSSSIKGAVLNLDSLTIESTARVACPEPIANLPSRHFELDPLAVVDAVEGVVVQLLNEFDDCAGKLVHRSQARWRHFCFAQRKQHLAFKYESVSNNANILAVFQQLSQAAKKVGAIAL